MLPRKERLSRQEFSRFFSVGKRYHSPALELVHAPHSTFHASVVVSKKVAKSAVKRNTFRRRIYDIVRLYKKEHGTSGIYILMAKPSILTLRRQALKDEVIGLIGRTEKSR